MEHRCGVRYPTDVEVRFPTGPFSVGVGRLTNVSASGAYMQTRQPLRWLSVLFLEPVEDPAVGRLAATVVRIDGSGVGLEWCSFSAKSTPAYGYFTHPERNAAHGPGSSR